MDNTKEKKVDPATSSIEPLGSSATTADLEEKVAKVVELKIATTSISISTENVIQDLEKDLAKISIGEEKDSKVKEEELKVEKLKDYKPEEGKTKVEKPKDEKPKDSKQQSNKKKGNSTKPPILSNPTIEGVAEYIKSGKCKNVIFMVGAGISTSAGIPDFRSPETGLFHQLEKYNLPYPEAVFDIGFFKSNPKPFFHLARELFPGNFTPTACHYFMKLIYDKGLLLRLYTQNIDGLERISGIPGEKLIESHGTFHTGHCINKRCQKSYTLEWMKKIVLSKEGEDNIPRCEDCSSYVKPDIIFYGEMLPERFYELIEKDFKQCDMLIIIGTSLTVQPFASLVDFVGNSVPRLMINLTKPDGGSFISKFIPGITSGMDFSSKSNVRNVFMKSDADLGCKKFAQLLNWNEHLDQLIKPKVIEEKDKIEEDKVEPNKEEKSD